MVICVSILSKLFLVYSIYFLAIPHFILLFGFTMKIYNAETVFVLKEDGPDVCVNRPELIVEYMKGAFDSHPEQESFWVILLDRKNFAKGRQMISLGTLSSCLAHPREIFRAAVVGSAAAIICVHNHPSGDPSPSSADVAVTRIIREASKVMEIDFLDHVIIGQKNKDPHHVGYYSFREAGIV